MLGNMGAIFECLFILGGKFTRSKISDLTVALFSLPH